MTSLIRMSFIESDGTRTDTTTNDGIFSGIDPMVHHGKACRSLTAQALISGRADDIERKASFLRRNAKNDPDHYLFMDGSCGEPFGELGSWPDCGDWIHREGQGWSGACRGHDGKAFEAPLFSFWLLQALQIMPRGIPRPRSGPRPPQIDGKKTPVAAFANLDWDWRSAGPERLESLLDARALSLDPEDSHLLQALAQWSHPQLALGFAAMKRVQSYVDLAGGDQALMALMDLRALSSTLTGSAKLGMRL